MKKHSKIKYKLSYWFFNFHREIMRTTAIGKKMLTASRTNAHLKDTYEQLGRLLEKGIENGEVDWDSPRIRALLHSIKACKKDLEEIEKKLNKLKFPHIEYSKKSDSEKKD
jgi:hypothetical protein